jgi:DNA ligase (NAD+)
VFSLVSAESKTFTYRSEEFDFLTGLGFEVVEHHKVTGDTVKDRIAYYAEKIQTYEIPSDGLVLCYEDIAYGKSLGMTAKFPRDAIAFKWQDETARTVLREIEWSPSRTGLINPVAIFDSVELEGTSVSRASVHNLSVLDDLKLGIGDEILVYKANMIIPQIAENITKSGNLEIPATCPCCGGPTSVRVVKEAKSLYCANPDCPAKQIKKFSLFVSRDAFNVDGLSEATLEKFVDEGFIKEYSDLFRLDRYHDTIVTMEGFGEKSYQNLMDSIEKARDISLPNFVYSLGILNIGLANAKVICKAFGNDLDKVLNLTKDELMSVDGIGEVIADSYAAYFADEDNKKRVDNLLRCVRMRKEDVVTEESLLTGKTVVVTGSLNLYASRKDLQEEIERRGAKLSGSVSKNTFVLVNNDVNSASSKNKTAKELGIPIMSEEDFVNTYLK